MNRLLLCVKLLFFEPCFKSVQRQALFGKSLLVFGYDIALEIAVVQIPDNACYLKAVVIEALN